MLTAVEAAFTLGSFGSDEMGVAFFGGRCASRDTTSILYAMAGGIVCNLDTLLLVAAMAIAGMAIGFLKTESQF